jgi:hypothetical protein
MHLHKYPSQKTFKQLQRELYPSENAVRAAVQQTEGFSFAYLKELFVSATMLWMSTKSEADRGSRASSRRGELLALNSMDRIILEEVARLRAQMASVASVATGRFSHALRIFQKA